MPKIATTQGPQQRMQVVRAPDARELPVSAFGIGEIGKGVSDLARGIAAMGDRVSIAEAEEASVRFERAKNDMFFNPETGYFNTQGKDAFNSAKDIHQAMMDLRDQFGANLSPQAAEAYKRVTDRHITNGAQSINQHASRGLKAWEVATAQSQVENAIENGAYYRSDPEQLKIQNALGRQSVIDAAELEGIDGDALNERLQSFNSAFYSSTIDAAITENANAGQESLDKYGDALEGALKEKFQAKIDTKLKAEQTQKTAGEAVLISTNLVNRHGNDRSAVNAEIDKIQDGELQKQVRMNANRLITINNTAADEAQAEAYESAEAFMLDNQNIEQWKIANPESWNMLSPKQQSALDNGKPIQQDWNVWNSFMSKSNEEIRRMSSQELKGITGRLDADSRKQVTAMWRSVRFNNKVSNEAQVGRTRNAQIQSTIEQMMGMKKKDWALSNLKKADTFYALVDVEKVAREEELGRPLTSKEFTDMLNDFTLSVVTDKGFIWDTVKTIDDIPEEHIGELSQALRDRGIPLTSSNLIKAYEQAIK